jgi:hypothetical protein
MLAAILPSIARPIAARSRQARPFASAENESAVIERCRHSAHEFLIVPQRTPRTNRCHARPDATAHVLVIAMAFPRCRNFAISLPRL